MKYEIQFSDKKQNIKKGMIFEWDSAENCYTTKEMPWFLTPLIDKDEMQKRVKLKQFLKVEK